MTDMVSMKKDLLTQQARNVLKRTAQDIIDLSQICHEYHEEFGYQEYIRWVKEDLGISKPMGCNLLNVHERFGSLNFRPTDIQPSVLYLLAAPSTPETARIVQNFCTVVTPRAGPTPARGLGHRS
jgi:hypothetical protein